MWNHTTVIVLSFDLPSGSSTMPLLFVAFHHLRQICKTFTDANKVNAFVCKLTYQGYVLKSSVGFRVCWWHCGRLLAGEIGTLECFVIKAAKVRGAPATELLSDDKHVLSQEYPLHLLVTLAEVLTHLKTAQVQVKVQPVEVISGQGLALRWWTRSRAREALVTRHLESRSLHKGTTILLNLIIMRLSLIL
jgi:hypothetical protein